MIKQRELGNKNIYMRNVLALRTRYILGFLAVLPLVDEKPVECRAKITRSHKVH